MGLMDGVAAEEACAVLQSSIHHGAWHHLHSSQIIDVWGHPLIGARLLPDLSYTMGGLPSARHECTEVLYNTDEDGCA